MAGELASRGCASPAARSEIEAETMARLMDFRMRTDPSFLTFNTFFIWTRDAAVVRLRVCIVEPVRRTVGVFDEVGAVRLRNRAPIK